MNFYKQKIKNKIAVLFSSTLLRNVLFTIGAIALFLSGVVVYGVVLNTREITLQETMQLKGLKKLDKVNLLIDRRTFTLDLYEDTMLVKSYRVSFGRNLGDKKKLKNDGATPVGVYKICDIITDHPYHKFLRLNYPNLEDGAEALKKSLLTQKQYDDLQFQFYYSDCVDENTVLGGNVGIQGIGRLNPIFKNLPFVYNWTDGSVALSNENLDELLTVIKKGTKVVIK